MIQYTFSVPYADQGVETLQLAEVCDKVSIADINPPLVATIYDSASTFTEPGMLTIY